MNEVLALASELISRVSVTPEDAGCQELIAARLAQLGFEAEWLKFGDVSNLLLTRGNGSPSLWFLGHTDIVPAGDESGWSSPPFNPEVRNGTLYGRGACDMKGAVAAMVVALESFARAHPAHQGQAGLLLTSDEEGEATHGIRKVAEFLKEEGRHPQYCLVGEPSSNQVLGDSVRTGRRGSIVATLEIEGIQGHTAFPETIENPIHRLAPFLSELVTTRWDEGSGDAQSGFPPTSCQVSNLNAGIGAQNVTPSKATLIASIRNNPSSPSPELEARFRDMLARHHIENYDLNWWVSGEPFQSPPGVLRKAVHDAVREELKVEPNLNTGGGTSDGRFMAPLGSEVIELGLVNESIHQVDENVSLDDLDGLVRTYRNIIERTLIS